jgi:hypothetical protein
MFLHFGEKIRQTLLYSDLNGHLTIYDTHAESHRYDLRTCSGLDGRRHPLLRRRVRVRPTNHHKHRSPGDCRLFLRPCQDRHHQRCPLDRHWRHGSLAYRCCLHHRQTHTHAHMHIHTQTHTDKHTHTHTHTQRHAHIYAYARHTHTHTNTHTHTHTRMYTHTHTRTHRRTHIHTHTHAHTIILRDTHTHTHTHTHT